MDEEQVKALIASALGDFETKLGGTIDTKNQGLAASLMREIKKLTAPEKTAEDPKPTTPEDGGETTGKLTLKALQQQLQQMQDSLKAEQEGRKADKDAAFKANRSAALSKAVAAAKSVSPALLEKVLNIEFGDNLKEEDGGWFVASGDRVTRLDEAIAAYLGTDEGKGFLPPSGTAGAGSSESTKGAIATDGTAKAVDALAQAF